MSGTREVSQIGGLRVDGFNVSWPFARLKATEDKITLVVFSKTYEIEKENISALRRHRGFLSVGLKIEHTKGGMPKHLVFWTFAFKKLKKALGELGYKVDA